MAHQLARIAWHLVTYQVNYDESVFALAEQQRLKRKQQQLRNLAYALGFDLVPQPAALTSNGEVP